MTCTALSVLFTLALSTLHAKDTTVNDLKAKIFDA